MRCFVREWCSASAGDDRAKNSATMIAITARCEPNTSFQSTNNCRSSATANLVLHIEDTGSWQLPLSGGHMRRLAQHKAQLVIVASLLLANVAVASAAITRSARHSAANRVCLREGCKCFGSGTGAICSELGDGDKCTKDSDCGASSLARIPASNRD